MADISIPGFALSTRSEPFRLPRRLRAIQRKRRRDRYLAHMLFTRDDHILADLGIDRRRARKYDWLAQLVRL